MWNIFKGAKVASFACGVLFGTAGIKILSSRDAKKVYTDCTAAGLRAKDELMKTATKLQENWNDIVEDAKEINAQRMDAQIIEDEAS